MVDAIRAAKKINGEDATTQEQPWPVAYRLASLWRWTVGVHVTIVLRGFVTLPSLRSFVSVGYAGRRWPDWPLKITTVKPND